MTQDLRAFTALLDDAAVFPPGNLPLAEAVAAHGFLNVLLATEAARRGAPPEEMAALLAQRDAAAVAGQVAGLGPEHLAAARSSFTSFGTCSVAGPRDDLIRLGLLPATAAA